MVQTKKQTHIEVITNQIVGIILNGLYLSFIMSGMIGITGNYWAATITTGVFFVLSYSRTYIIRRIFNKLHN